mmetsp:Transcript_29076/g.52042  ORF Transcript_29076/g.52042 Transcript_29076/m.52042 type:complete len:365 (+) Transcript_29076:2204-3298(+)
MHSALKLERTRTKSWLDRSGLESDKAKRVKEINTELAHKIAELAAQLELEKDRNRSLEKELSRREQRYLMKEQTLRRALEHYEQDAHDEQLHTPLSDIGKKQFDKIESLHKQLTQSISVIQHKTAHEIKRSEEEIVRQFDNRLKEVATTLEKDKKSKYETIQSFAEKESIVQKKLDLMTASLQLIETKNRELEAENKQLKLDLKLLKEEHYMYIKKSCSQRSVQITMSNTPMVLSPKMSLPPSPTNIPILESRYDSKVEDAQILRYEKVITKLKKMLELERKALKNARAAYSKELENKNELQQILRQAIEAVREDSRMLPAMQRDKNAKKMIAEKLANDEQILTYLYDSAFAKVTSPKSPLTSS